MRERNRGKDLERIWKRFGDTKQNNQKLEKKFESAFYQRNNKFNTVRPKALGQADRLLLFIRGHGLKELPPSSGRGQELDIRVQKTRTHAIVNILLFLR